MVKESQGRAIERYQDACPHFDILVLPTSAIVLSSQLVLSAATAPSRQGRFRHFYNGDTCTAPVLVTDHARCRTFIRLFHLAEQSHSL